MRVEIRFYNYLIGPNGEPSTAWKSNPAYGHTPGQFHYQELLRLSATPPTTTTTTSTTAGSPSPPAPTPPPPSHITPPPSQQQQQPIEQNETQQTD